MKTQIVHIRMESELKAKLEKMALADNRKLSDFIRVQLLKLAELTNKKK